MKKHTIHIKPENRGKFNATKKATGKTTEQLTHSSNPVTRKRAIFAQNARKWKHPDGGEVGERVYTPEERFNGNIVAREVMNRNRDKNFVQRAYNVADYPESKMFTQPDANDFGSYNSHLMGWGTDDQGQAWMSPEIFNPTNEAIQVPNQYADYVSTYGYKDATGMKYKNGGKVRRLPRYTGGGETGLIDKFGNPTTTGAMAGAGAMGFVNILGAEEGRDRGEAIGSTVGNVAGQALNMVVPGLGAIAGPILGKIAGKIGGNIAGRNDETPAQIAEKNRINDEATDRFNRGNQIRSDKTYETNNFTFPYGGEVGDPNAELELNEQFQTPDGGVGQVDGPSHEEGGIPTALPEGTRIYSDRLKYNGKTFAKTVKPINSKISKLEKELETNPNDQRKQNSIMLMNQQLDHYFNKQEELKQNNEMKRSIKYAKGGLVKYYGGGTNQWGEPNSNPFDLQYPSNNGESAWNVNNNSPWDTSGKTDLTPWDQLGSQTPNMMNATPNPYLPTPAEVASGYGKTKGPDPADPSVPVDVGVRQPRNNTGFRLNENNYENAPTKTDKFGNFLGNNAGQIGQVGTAALTAFLQNRNLNKLKAPRKLDKLNLADKLGNPNLVDYSAQRNDIDQGYLASADSAQRNLSNSATAQAFKNQANLARLKGTGESWQNQQNTNTQIENEFLQQRNQAEMREAMMNNEVDKYNLENAYNYDTFKTGQKGAILGQLGSVGSQVFGNQTKYANELEQARIMANRNEGTVNSSTAMNSKYEQEMFNEMSLAQKQKHNEQRQRQGYTPLPIERYGGTVGNRSLSRYAEGGSVRSTYHNALQERAIQQPVINNSQTMDEEYTAAAADPTKTSYRSNITGLDYKIVRTLPKNEKRLLAADLWREAHGSAPTKSQEEATIKAIEGRKTSSPKAKAIGDTWGTTPPKAGAPAVDKSNPAWMGDNWPSDPNQVKFPFKPGFNPKGAGNPPGWGKTPMDIPNPGSPHNPIGQNWPANVGDVNANKPGFNPVGAGFPEGWPSNPGDVRLNPRNQTPPGDPGFSRNGVNTDPGFSRDAVNTDPGFSRPIPGQGMIPPSIPGNYDPRFNTPMNDLPPAPTSRPNMPATYDPRMGGMDNTNVNPNLQPPVGIRGPGRKPSNPIFNQWPEGTPTQGEQNQYDWNTANRGRERPAPLRDAQGNLRSEAIESQGSVVEDILPTHVGAALVGLGAGYLKKKAMKAGTEIGEELIEKKVKRTIRDELGNEGYEAAMKKAKQGRNVTQMNANKKRAAEWVEKGKEEFAKQRNNPEFKKKLTRRIEEAEDEMLPNDILKKKLDKYEIPSAGKLREQEILRDLRKAKDAGDIKLFNKIMSEYRRTYKP